MNEEAISHVGSQLHKNKYAQPISFGRDKAVSLMLLLEQSPASSARRVPTDRLFIVPTCRVHSSCAPLERGSLILFSSCPKIIVVKPLMCIHFWFFIVKVCRLFYLIFSNPSCSEHVQPLTYVTVSGSFCMRLRDDGMFAESPSSSVISRPLLFAGLYFAVSQIRGVLRRIKLKILNLM